MLDEEVVDAEFLPFGEGVDAGEDAAVLVEVSRLQLADLALDHAHQDLLYLLSELLRLALPALRSVEAAHPEDKSSRCSVQVENGLDRVSIGNLADLGEEGLIIEGELRRILGLHEFVVLLHGHGLQL